MKHLAADVCSELVGCCTSSRRARACFLAGKRWKAQHEVPLMIYMLVFGWSAGPFANRPAGCALAMSSGGLRPLQAVKVDAPQQS